MSVYEAENYRQFMDSLIRPKAKRTWGAVKRLATVLKCHSTYVSQIINGKADLSTEQALGFCRFFQLDQEATHHFVDLLSRDKAGNLETRDYFQSKIEKRLADRLNLKKRMNINESLSSEQEAKYYRGWLPQAVHMCCQLPEGRTAKSIAARLTVPEHAVASILKDLESIGLIEADGSTYKCLKDSVYLGKDSPTISRFHVNWRLKTVSEMTTTAKLPGTHYSSVLSMSRVGAKQLRELVLRHVEESRALIISSPSEEIYSYCLDFYPLTAIQSD